MGQLTANIHCSSRLQATAQVFFFLLLYCVPLGRWRCLALVFCCRSTVKRTHEIDTIKFVPMFAFRYSLFNSLISRSMWKLTHYFQAPASYWMTFTSKFLARFPCHTHFLYIYRPSSRCRNNPVFSTLGQTHLSCSLPHSHSHVNYKTHLSSPRRKIVIVSNSSTIDVISIHLGNSTECWIKRTKSNWTNHSPKANY